MTHSPHIRPLPHIRLTLRTLLLACVLLCGMLFALPASTAYAASPAQETPAAGAIIYQSAILPAASSPGRVVTLTLDSAGGAIMSTDYMNGEDPLVEEGTYLREGDRLSVTLTGRADLAYEVPVQIVFTEEVDGSLVATEYDQSLFGSEGLTLLLAEPAGDGDTIGAGTASLSATDTPTVTVETVAGVYASGTMPAADTPGLEMTLTLNEDGSATVSTDYMNDEPAIEEVAKWVLNDDGSVTLTVTGQADIPYDEPQVIEMSLLPNGALKTTAPDFYDGAGITFTPVLEDPAGVYVSQIVPAASSPGMVIFMILYATGDVQASTYYLNNAPPVQETGIWTENVDSSVTVTVTASADLTYEQPQTLVFQRSGDTLSFLSLTLTRLEEAPSTTGPEPIAWFQTDVMPAASSPGLQQSLILYDDNSVQMISDYMNGEPPVVEVGNYVDNDDGTMTVTLTGQLDRDYNKPDVITFAQDGDTLTAIEFDEVIYGSGGMTLTEQPLDDLAPDEDAAGNAAADNGAAETLLLSGTEGLTDTVAVTETGTVTESADSFEVPSGALGVYVTDVLPAASSPGMQMRLVLFTDNSAQMITDYMNGEDPIIELGKWTEDAGGNINVSLLGRIANVYETPVQFVFERSDTGLVAIEYDTTLYGSSGLIFNTEFEV